MNAVKGNSLILISSYEYLDIIKSGDDRISSIIFEPFTMGKLANSLKEIDQGKVYRKVLSLTNSSAGNFKR
jgi:hypothetical protein